jgi:hypothetical protein
MQEALRAAVAAGLPAMVNQLEWSREMRCEFEMDK